MGLAIFIDSICEEVLGDEGDTDMRSDSKSKGREPYPQFEDTFVGYGLV